MSKTKLGQKSANWGKLDKANIFSAPICAFAPILPQFQKCKLGQDIAKESLLVMQVLHDIKFLPQYPNFFTPYCARESSKKRYIMNIYIYNSKYRGKLGHRGRTAKTHLLTASILLTEIDAQSFAVVAVVALEKVTEIPYCVSIKVTMEHTSKKTYKIERGYHLSVRMPEQTARALAIAARTDGRTISQYAVRTIQQHLAERVAEGSITL